MTDDNNNSSDNSSLQDIDASLRDVEDGLRTSSDRRRGRGFFDSVNSILDSLRERLDRHDTTSSNAANLNERLQTAAFAHSHRIPLDVLRSRHFVQLRTSETSLSFRRATALTQKEEEESEPKEEEKEADASEYNSSSQQGGLRIFRRTNSLVASRTHADRLADADMDLHEDSSLALLSYVEETQIVTSHNGESMVFETSVGIMTMEKPSVEPPVEPPALILPKRSLATMPSLSRSISGSIDVPIERDDETFDHVVYSWGPASSHSLHDDGIARTASEAQVSPKSRVGRAKGILSVACGPRHSAYATTQGEIYTCGDNRSGAVDPTHESITEVTRPTMLENLCSTVVKQVSCGWDHTAALTSTGAVLAWGGNEAGQLGHFSRASENIKTTFCRPKTMFLGPGNRAASVACGDKFTLVLTTRMSVLACGVPTIAGYSPAGEGQDLNPKLPGELPALVGLPLASIAAGKDHAVVLTVHGSAYAWGKNATGCCGRPYPEESSSPVPILMPTTQLQTPLGETPFHNWSTWRKDSAVSLADDVAVVHAACGYDHTVLVTRSGTLLVCGSNDEGQLGVESGSCQKRIQTVHHPEKTRRFISAEAGEKTTLLLDDKGDVFQMGRETNGELRRVLSGKNIITIAVGGQQYVAVAEDGAKNLTFSMNEEKAVCKSTGSPLARSLETLVESVSNEMQTDGSPLSENATELVSTTSELLKNPAVLNSLFLDPTELDALFKEISTVDNPQLQQALALATEKSIHSALDGLQSSGARMIYPESVRCLLHYIRFFERSEDSTVQFDISGQCIMALCEAFLSLPYEGFKAMLAWMTLYPRDAFVTMLVRPLLSQLSRSLRIEVDANGVQHSQISRKAVPMIVSVLRWLHRASERTGNALPEDFYSEAVDRVPLEALFEDLRALKKYASQNQKPSTFLICASPFLIPPSKKRDLLLIESQVQMMKAATQDASINVSDGTVTIDPFFVLEIERERLLEQTLHKVKKANPLDIRKKLRVKFKDEEGVDAGGVTKEFFQLLSEALFDINSGMWTRRYGDEITWFNSNCTWDQEGYELVGLLVGLALYNGVLVDVAFPSAVYRKWLDLSLGLEDLVDEEIKKGLQQLLDYQGDDVEDIFCLTFEVTSIDVGEERKVELKPGGADIPVTSSNKEEYVLLYVKWILVDSVELQWNSFKKGVMRVLGDNSLDLFRPEELELFVVGTPELDFCALENNTEYEGGFDRDSPVVKNLWRFVKQADRETETKFLKFVTGTSKAPIGGLGAMPFKIQKAGPDSAQLPTSHTCFNTLLLPDYGTDYEKLAERLGRAILECEGFGLE